MRWASVVVLLFAFSDIALAQERLLLATFNVDATPKIGMPVAYAPARSIDDPLSARGIVLWSSSHKPVVLCAVDWIGIANASHWFWKESLAAAADTTPDRVAVHTLHQHDGFRCDFSTAELLNSIGQAGKHFDVGFSREVVHRTSDAIRHAMKSRREITHIGSGQAKVDKVASNRRILGPDGKVKIVRYSSTKIPEAIAAPEGVIDPVLRTVSFWNGEKPLAALTYYATHPQSYYGQGDVTAEFIGLARTQREKALPGVHFVHFNGAGGNIAAGKYNDGSKPMRAILTQRVADGMRASWDATIKDPISAADLDWRFAKVALPVSEKLERGNLMATLNDPAGDFRQQFTAANNLAWLLESRSGKRTECACLRLGKIQILHMPGELFVEYQLAAQQMRADSFVCMAAYGDYGPGYICTEVAYSQGGYEPSVSLVAPSVEGVLMNTMRELLE
jgi:hypothetical protein